MDFCEYCSVLKVSAEDSQKESIKEIKESVGGVAQLGEHLPCKQGVRSSNLLISTRVREKGRIAQAVRAHA